MISDSGSEHNATKRRPNWTRTFVEGVDYYLDEDGNYVFTAHFLKAADIAAARDAGTVPMAFGSVN